MSWCSAMRPALGPLLETLLFTIFVPGTVAVAIPRALLDRPALPSRGPLAWVGVFVLLAGAGIEFRCAGEFAVRGLDTPAAIASTKSLVVTGLHRYVRNPMYIGVYLIILGQAALFRAARLAEYGTVCIFLAHLFVIFYEEPALRCQFGPSYDEYRRSVPRRIPRAGSSIPPRRAG